MKSGTGDGSAAERASRRRKGEGSPSPAGGAGAAGRDASGSAPASRTRTAPDVEGDRRRARSTETRRSILAAALAEFSTRGFAATRLDDVARRAGVAKGTIYVHFRDKETLFEELVRFELGPVVATIEAPHLADLPLRVFASALVETFLREIYGTQRRDVLRLIISEGERFPQLSQIYYREVIRPSLTGLRATIERALARGEIRNDALLRFPQLLIAPGLMGVMWDARFSRFEPLDMRAMMEAHLDLLFAGLEQERA